MGEFLDETAVFGSSSAGGKSRSRRELADRNAA